MRFKKQIDVYTERERSRETVGDQRKEMKRMKDVKVPSPSGSHDKQGKIT
jgi:hypothetical protein